MRYVVLLAILFSGSAPLGNLDRIKRAFEKLEYDKAFELISKAYEKDPTDAGTVYYSALLHSIDSFRGFDLDTARIIIRLAEAKFEKSADEVVAELADEQITMSRIDELSNHIRDRIYEIVKANVSVAGAERFMVQYPDSPYHERLIFRRDSIVFEKVRKNDSLGVYERFLAQYSTMEFREIAIKRIDELRFQVLAHSGALKDYYQFLENYPATNFRSEIERFVFKNATVDHRPESYIAFIEFAEDKVLKKKAADILYYVQLEEPMSFFHPKSDSLRKIRETENLKVIPAMEDGKFGFHSNYGSLQIPYLYDDVDYDYKCDLTEDDWLLVKDGKSSKIVNRMGTIVVEDLDEYVDLSSGAALVKRKRGSYLYHKSGFKILESSIEDAAVMGERWIRVLKDGKWALVSFSGKLITDFEFDDIRREGIFWIFEKDRLLAVYTEQLIEDELNERGLDLEFKFDDLELISENSLIGFRDDRECMLDENLRFLIPWGVYEINPDESGWYLKTSLGYRLYDHSEQDIMNQVHPYLETNAGWLALKTNQDWMLLPRARNVMPSRGYDSLKLLNDFSTFAIKDDKRKLIFSNGVEIDLDSQKVQSFFNQPSYLLIDDVETMSIVDSAGSELLKGSFDEVTFFNDSLVKVKFEGKSGLMKLDSAYQLELEYDAIDEENGLVLSLKDGMIGCLDLETGTRISSNYEARIERIGTNYLVKQRGKFGLIDALEDSVISFSYDEIKFWNDTSFLVRNGSEWNFLNYEEEVVEEPVEFLTEIVGAEEETIWKYVRDGKYGLLSNLNGFLLTPEFTDIFNIGSVEEPVFFADQHLDKAGFHVVSYLDKSGNLLLSKAYTKSEFEKILCDD